MGDWVISEPPRQPRRTSAGPASIPEQREGQGRMFRLPDAQAGQGQEMASQHSLRIGISLYQSEECRSLTSEKNLLDHS
jgi:hypothetical protein